LKANFILVYSYKVLATNPCLTVNCNFGTCVTNSSLSAGYQCVCNIGYSGATCTTSNYVCTKAGTFADPVDCKNYVTCTLGQFLDIFFYCKCDYHFKKEKIYCLFKMQLVSLLPHSQDANQLQLQMAQSFNTITYLPQQTIVYCQARSQKILHTIQQRHAHTHKLLWIFYLYLLCGRNNKKLTFFIKKSFLYVLK
jgi:hypothetical protein